MGMVFKNRELRRCAIIPWIVNFFVFFGAIISFGVLDTWLMTRLNEALGTGWWVAVTAWLIGIILFLAFGAGLVISFTYIVNLLTGVFAEQLSYQTEFLVTGIKIPSPEGEFMKIWIRSIVESLKGMAFFLAIWVSLLFLNFIPVIGTGCFLVASMLWGTLALAFEFTAPAVERRGYRFGEKYQLIRRHPLESVGLGAGILILTMIPVINLFFIPSAIVAGTRWVADLEPVPATLIKAEG